MDVLKTILIGMMMTVNATMKSMKRKTTKMTHSTMMTADPHTMRRTAIQNTRIVKTITTARKMTPQTHSAKPLWNTSTTPRLDKCLSYRWTCLMQKMMVTK